MRFALTAIMVFFACLLPRIALCEDMRAGQCTVPFVLDHNRMLIDAEIQRADGTWRPARLWVDTGNPSLYMSEAFARDLGYDLPADRQNADVAPPRGVRIGGMEIDFRKVTSRVMFEPPWLFGATHADANLPSTVMQRYRIVFDYPIRQLTIAEPGIPTARGERVPASVNRETGIVQMDVNIGGDNLSFALDNGASYSFISGNVLDSLLRDHTEWPLIVGTIGCANMWGWWPPNEALLPVARIPEIVCGAVRFTGVGIVGTQPLAAGGPTLGEWYSRKTARPVDGFLGPNAFKAFRVEIDYAGGAMYFEKGAEPDMHDMDIIGLTLRPEADGGYTVLGVSSKNGKPLVPGVEQGDRLLRIDDVETTGATMGTVVDALRGSPGDVRTLLLERGGERFTVKAEVHRLL